MVFNQTNKKPILAWKMKKCSLLECKKWSTNINKEFAEKVNFEWLDKEFKTSQSSDQNKRKYRIPLSIVRCFNCGR